MVRGSYGTTTMGPTVTITLYMYITVSSAVVAVFYLQAQVDSVDFRLRSSLNALVICYMAMPIIEQVGCSWARMHVYFTHS